MVFDALRVVSLFFHYLKSETVSSIEVRYDQNLTNTFVTLSQLVVTDCCDRRLLSTGLLVIDDHVLDILPGVDGEILVASSL